MANLERTGSRVLAIVISDLRTGLRRHVADVGSLHYNDAPVWSPNGTMFAFQNPHGEGELPIPITIDVATADGSRVWTVSDGLEAAFSPSWSPDGSQLVFTSDGAVFIVNADGSGRRGLTGPIGAGQPMWLTSTELGFVRHGATGYNSSDLFSMRTDGTELRQMTTGGAFVASVGSRPFPQSADGRCIAYLKERYPSGSATDVHAVCLGGAEQRITDEGTGHSYFWLTDGRVGVMTYGGTRACAGLLAVRIETNDGECIVY